MTETVIILSCLELHFSSTANISIFLFQQQYFSFQQQIFSTAIFLVSTANISIFLFHEWRSMVIFIDFLGKVLQLKNILVHATSFPKIGA